MGNENGGYRMKPKHFVLHELFPPETIKKHGNDCYFLLDVNLMITIDAIHDLFPGSVMIANTWGMIKESIIRYGTYTYRGYRPVGCGVGKPSGAHYAGKALDFDVWRGTKKLSAEYVREIIIENRAKLPHLKGLEESDWLHVDVMERKGQPKDKICVFDVNNNWRYI